ncbi:MAG TPA: hypothetical protein VKZ61_09395 [Thermomicrobiales bacterium]|jgi:hypothetical protein|nr:hypothetical protein [Thermomicrobiales bacterium]
MITLGGWLFADLLLGLSMLFLVANTVGAPPPEPTPTPLPNYEATAEAQIAQADVEAQQTVEAIQAQLEDAEAAAQATEDARATREAMSASERATMDAEATEQAVVAQATIEALSTEQAESQSSREELDNELATTVAEATNVAAQVEAQATEQAALQAQATENAESGVNAQGTSAALENQVATSQAQVEEAQATSDAAQNELLQAQEQVQLNSLNPNAIPVTIQVDLEGVISGDDEALEDAREELGVVLDPFLEAESCRLGFVLISSRSPDIGQGIQLSDRIATMIEEDYTAILPDAADGGDPALASESIALPGTTPTGEVQLLLFMSSGCQVEG